MSKKAPADTNKRHQPRESDTGAFRGPSGPFGSIDHKIRAFRGNANTFAGRREQSRERYVPIEPTE